ncbi:MAG: SirB2 family protein [Rhodocyclaceae bacterium]|nr:SirB2 family protein [Rhodocyclaceae bacterium]MDZ4214657.1 SirB2 family protein [Rhodocyclaceae bacterium]
MSYTLIKHLHVACVILSIGGFCLRGVLRLGLAKKSALAGRLSGKLRWLPHVNDTVLLVAALVLAVRIGQYPFVDAWLTAKVLGLIAYIILGSLALTAGRPARLRIAAGLMAVVVFGWIISVALSKHPVGFLLPIFV